MPLVPTTPAKRRLLAVVVICVLLGIGVLGWNFPARWALPWLTPHLHGMQLEDVEGSLWNGTAGHVLTHDGRVLGRAEWQVPRRVLFTQVPVRLRINGPQFAFSGAVRFERDGRSAWSDVRLRTDLALWPALAAALPGPPEGEWQLTVPRALLQHGWPLTLDLRGEWRDAALRVQGGRLALGDFAWDADARGGVVQARVHDVAGGPLHATGELLVGPLGWRLDARLRAATDGALRRWLATLGPVAADGSLHLVRHGGLLPLPAPAASSAGADGQTPVAGGGY